MKPENRLFVADVPLSVLQNLVTALDPALLTEHSLMLLFNDLSRVLPIEELPHRMLDLMTDYFSHGEDDDDDSEPAVPTH